MASRDVLVMEEPFMTASSMALGTSVISDCPSSMPSKFPGLMPVIFEGKTDHL